jgi:Tat protein secretion system quality control protein TatD with DNase activity
MTTPIPYIDIHTHQVYIPGDSVISVLNKDVARVSESCDYYSTSLHPWYIDEWRSLFEDHPNPELLSHFHEMVSGSIFMGELGLDRFKGNFNEQQEFLSKIILYLKKHWPQKNFVYILHWVKSQEQLKKFMNTIRPGSKVIIHGYNGSVEETKYLLKTYPNLYISFSPHSKNKILMKELLSIAAQRFFLESDDKEILSLKSHYEDIALLCEQRLSELKLEQYELFQKIVSS